jgi:outer membrane receptor protein involved in Fe transport
MIRLYTSIFLLVFISSSLFAQHPGAGRPGGQQDKPKGKITGKVIDSQTGAPIEYATIGVFRSADSILVTGNITNSAGLFVLEVPYGKVYVNVDFIGYTAKMIPAFTLSESAPHVDIGVVKLTASATALEGVEVETEKSQYQVGIDKKVFNVGKDLTSAGGSAADILQNVPSVTVDMDGNVALRGSGGVRVLVDGKPSGLTGVSKSDILAQIPASSIESIEVITNPSAKYDSEGMAGIINIVLKKQQQKGFNAMVNGQAGTGDRYNGSVNFNYSKGKFNVFGSYDLRSDHRYGNGVSNRKAIFTDSIAFLEQRSSRVRGNFTHNTRLGADIRLNDMNTLTLSALYKTSDGKSIEGIDYQELDANRTVLSIFERESQENDNDRSYDLSMSYRKNYKQKGRMLTADIQYSLALEDEVTDMTERHYNLDYTPMNIDPVKQLSIDNNTQVNGMAQIDYVHPLSESSKMESGVKGSLRSTIVDFTWMNYDNVQQHFVNDTSVSNRFFFGEQIYAAYGIYSNGYKKLSYKIGARVEQTYTLSKLFNTGEITERDYIDIFPSIHLGQDLANKNKLTLSYTRRINRPSFGNLNPFNDFQDPYNLRTGNPQLRPEYISSFDAGHSKYWESYTLSSGLYYRHTTDMIGRVRTLDTLTGVAVTSFENMNTGISYGAELTLNASPAKWVRGMLSFNYYRNIIKGENVREGFESDAYSWNTRLNTTFTVWKNLDIQVTANYRAPMIVPMGTIRPMYSIDLGAKKDILKNKATVNVRVSDLLNSQRFRIDAAGPGFENYLEHRWDTRAFYAGFSYRINSYKEKPQDRRQGPPGGGDMDF